MASIESCDPAPDQRVIEIESRNAVRVALEKLEDAFRLPLLLHYFQDLSVAEIAVIMDIPEGTVKTRLARGREKLKAEVAGTGGR
jgi:RNA polymerase sigma-70 factor (ECF subfamily)